MSPVHTVFIANRGEIATRIIRTCHKLGKRAVIGYHDFDSDTLAVRMADAAVRLDGPNPVATYLSIDNIVAACKQLGADAVHPGFGFLAEKPNCRAGWRRKASGSLGQIPKPLTRWATRFAPNVWRSRPASTSFPDSMARSPRPNRPSKWRVRLASPSS